MRCPNCYFDNQENANVCESCGEDLYPLFQPEYKIRSNAGTRRQGKFGSCIGQLLSGMFTCLTTMIVLSLIMIAILALLIYHCRLNIPILPRWDFLPKNVISYWNWADDWQMERCPTLTEGNYFFGKEPLPRFDDEGELLVESEYSQASITFSPWSAPAGSSFEISLDGFSANDTIHACWYYPSGALVNCTDLKANENGHRDTLYWSNSAGPIGKYLMEAQGQYTSASAQWTVE